MKREIKTIIDTYDAEQFKELIERLYDKQSICIVSKSFKGITKNKYFEILETLKDNDNYKLNIEEPKDDVIDSNFIMIYKNSFNENYIITTKLSNDSLDLIYCTYLIYYYGPID